MILERGSASALGRSKPGSSTAQTRAVMGAAGILPALPSLESSVEGRRDALPTLISTGGVGAQEPNRARTPAARICSPTLQVRLQETWETFCSPATRRRSLTDTSTIFTPSRAARTCASMVQP